MHPAVNKRYMCTVVLKNLEKDSVKYREAFNNPCYLGKASFSGAENKLRCSNWVLSFILKHIRMTKAFSKNLFKNIISSS